MIPRAFVASLLALSFPPQAAPSSKPAPPSVPEKAVPANPFPDLFGPHGQQIFFAVLEGLYQDGVTNEVVDKVIAIDEDTKYPANFVWSCPVCMPAYEAFSVYRGRPMFHDKEHRDNFGTGLPPDQIARLTAVDQAVSQSEIENLILGWMERRMDALRLTVDDRAEWRTEMENRRKEGMSYLERYRQAGMGGSYAAMKTCPICEGANGACKMR